jgi:hypothetical protein
MCTSRQRQFRRPPSSVHPPPLAPHRPRTSLYRKALARFTLLGFSIWSSFCISGWIIDCCSAAVFVVLLTWRTASPPMCLRRVRAYGRPDVVACASTMAVGHEQPLPPAVSEEAIDQLGG